MYKIISIIISALILLQSFNINFDDVNKLPNLYEHIACHINHGHNIVEFMSLHYGSTSKIHDTENSEHQNLPFKHKNKQTNFNVDYLIKNVFSISIPKIDLKETIFSYNKITSQLVIYNFFKPPRLV